MSDEAHWASAFLNHTLQKSGGTGTRDRHALSWLTWGVPAKKPAFGSVAVLKYTPHRGHVGLVVGAYEGNIVLLGGNQSNAVNRTAFPPEDIVAYRLQPGHEPHPLDYDLPEAKPDAPAKTVLLRSASAPDSKVTSYTSDDGCRRLSVKQLGHDKIAFDIATGGACSRHVSGTAFEIYPEDMEVESDGGVGFPVKEYFFWNDAEGKSGVTIRLSAKGAPRARIADWGFDTTCQLGGE